MKTNFLSAIATAVALTLATSAYAQYKPASDDGIAASPKLRQMLNEKKAATASRVAPTTAMACTKCAEVQTAKVSPQAKGAEVMTGVKQVTSSHACASCGTTFIVAGEGKAKHQVATHKCSMNVASKGTCCSSK